MTIEPIGDIADVSLTSADPAADLSRAQMLAQAGHPPETIEREAGVSVSVAQALVLEHGNS